MATRDVATEQSVKVSRRGSVYVPLFSLTLFMSAALLFLLEPMFAKMTLPVLGGTTAVWATCMAFYQAILLAGYAFANFVTRRMSSRLMTTADRKNLLLETRGLARYAAQFHKIFRDHNLQ